MKYLVYNHHDFWQREQGEDSLEDAQVAFMWADWPFAKEVSLLRYAGKKVIVYEHGFGALWDYELNHRPPIADGYLAMGQASRDSLIRVGVDASRILIAGNPIYDDIKEVKPKGNKALFVALHWVRDLKEYNETTFKKLQEAYPEFEWTIKLNDKTSSFGDVDKWVSDTNKSILQDIKDRLPEFSVVFTPRPSTFESFARLMGIPVYVVDQEQSYAEEGDPGSMPINNTYLKIGDKLPEQKRVDMSKYIKRPSLSLDIILDWTKTL